MIFEDESDNGNEKSDSFHTHHGVIEGGSRVIEKDCSECRGKNDMSQ